MGYTIEALPIQNLDDATIRLPRFQRKSTWKPDQNFQLCISVFKEFPLGVMIINREKNNSWLLDGRQRRTALRLMRENPVEVYNWASRFLRFGNSSTDEIELTKTFWKRIDIFLQKDVSETEKEQQKDEDTGEEYIDSLDEEIDTYSSSDDDDLDEDDSWNKQESLNSLLGIILMVHPIRNKQSRFERIFDFKKYFSRLDYAPKNKKETTDPVLLRKFLLEMLESFGKEHPDDLIHKDYVVEHYLSKYDIEDNERVNFSREVGQKWDEMLRCFKVIQDTEKVFKDARIGVIWLNNASAIDAQNIFSLVNSGGTLLKAEELLSAKPYWNVPVNNVDKRTQDKIHAMYKHLGVSKPKDIVRWDLLATILQRVDLDNFIFKSYDSDELQIEQITLGFKLVSSFLAGGMSAKDVIKLEELGDIDWVERVNDVVDGVNEILEIIQDINYFKYLSTWRYSITQMLSNAPALEFIIVMYKRWESKGSPRYSSGDLKSLQRDAIILFDRLIYEYSTGAWGGSGDSKLSSHIKDISKRFEPISTEQWTILVEKACYGHDGNKTKNVTRALLYHYYSIKSIQPTRNNNTTYEVDHIFPKEKFVDNLNVKIHSQDSLFNFALLPKKDNIKKGSKSLKEITDKWLQEEISRFSEIPIEDFEKYSDITNLEELREYRLDLFLKTFRKERDSLIAN